VATPLDPLSSPSGIRFAPRSGHTSFLAVAHGASSIFCSSRPWDSPLRGFTKDCSRQSFARPKNVTQITAPLHPAIAAFVHPCTSRAPHHARRCQSRLPGSVRATSCGAHLDWPSLANRPFQSRLTTARVKGTWPDGSLGCRPTSHGRCRCSRRVVSVPPSDRPSIVGPAGSGPKG